MTLFLQYWSLYITNIHYKILSVLRLCNKGVQLVPGNSLGFIVMFSPRPSPLSRIHILLSEMVANSLSLNSFLASLLFWDCVMFPVDLRMLTSFRIWNLEEEKSNCNFSCLPGLVGNMRSGLDCRQTVTNFSSLSSLSASCSPSLSLYLYRINRMTTMARTKLSCLNYISW